MEHQRCSDGELDLDDDANYVSCLTDGRGFLSLDAGSSAGGSDNFNWRIENYHGADTYTYTWRTGGGVPSSEIRLTGRYQYWFFYDYSETGGPDVPSTCTFVVTEIGGPDRIDATITCMRYTAQITSPDYDSRDASGYRAYVAVNAHFRCAI